MKFVKVNSGCLVNMDHVKSIFIDKCRMNGEDAWDVNLSLNEEDFYIYSRCSSKEAAEKSMHALLSELME